MILSSRNITKFQSKIFTWWMEHKRDLPWRHTNNPYNILISEIMLQQTQVDRVLPKYAEFIAKYPDVYRLSEAPVSEVLRIWKGLGYNRRALFLQKTASHIVRKYEGVFPETEKQLLELPGIGLYTARALLVFAYKKNVSMVDTNVRQIITHYFFDDILQTPKSIEKAADRLVPKDKSWEWHQALMDFGSLELKKLRIKKNGLKKTVPFKESPRYIRGKIIDELRNSDMPVGLLISKISNLCDKPCDIVLLQLQRLTQEGLCVISSDGSAGLPQ